MDSTNNWMERSINESWKDFANKINNHAKKIFLEDGYHSPMMALCSRSGAVDFVSLIPAIELCEGQKVNWKLAVSRSLQAMAANNQDLDAVIFITESWAYKTCGENDHISKQIMNGEISISELNPEHRNEILNVIMTARDGQDITFVTPIIRDGDKVSLGESEDLTAGKGRLGSDIWQKPIPKNINSINPSLN